MDGSVLMIFLALGTVTLYIVGASILGLLLEYIEGYTQ